MNKKIVRFAACCLSSTLLIGNSGLVSAAESQTELPSAGIEALINDCYSSSTDVSIVEHLTKTVNSGTTGLAFAKVSDYVNIRSAANEESEAVGKLYSNGAATVLGTEGEWTKIESGSVTGYIRNDYLAVGEEADALAEQVGKKTATVNTETLKVREQADLNATVQTLVPIGEELNVTGEAEGWIGVTAEDGTAGFVSEDYVEIKVEYGQAESKEEEAARLAAEEAKRQAERERQAAEARAAAEARQREQQRASSSNRSSNSSSSNSSSSSSSSSNSSSSNSSSSKKSTSNETAKPSEPAAPSSGSGQAVANYACQFVGNPYKWGGSSLTSGADCSGFVMAVYAKFGRSLPHSSSAMRSVGTGVSYSEARPGDIICYSGHVGIYVGNGQIVNALNQKSGITYTSATYKNIITVRRIFN